MFNPKEEREKLNESVDHIYFSRASNTLILFFLPYFFPKNYGTMPDAHHIDGQHSGLILFRMIV